MSRKNKMAAIVAETEIAEVSPAVAALVAELAADDVESPVLDVGTIYAELTEAELPADDVALVGEILPPLPEAWVSPVPEGWSVIEGGPEDGGFDVKLDDPAEIVAPEPVSMEFDSAPEVEPEPEVTAALPVVAPPVVAMRPRLSMTLPEGASPETVQAGIAAALATGYGVDLRTVTGELILALDAPVTAAKAGKPVAAAKVARVAKAAVVAVPKAESARAAGTRAMVAALQGEGGATLAELATVAGWDNVPNAFHLRRALTPLGLVLCYDERTMPKYRKYWAMKASAAVGEADAEVAEAVAEAVAA